MKIIAAILILASSTVAMATSKISLDCEGNDNFGSYQVRFESDRKDESKTFVKVRQSGVDGEEFGSDLVRLRWSDGLGAYRQEGQSEFLLIEGLELQIFLGQGWLRMNLSPSGHKDVQLKLDCKLGKTT